MHPKNAVEAVLFAVVDGMSVEDMSKLLKLKKEEIRSVIEELKQEYAGKGIEITEIGGKVQMAIKGAMFPVVREFAKPEISNTLMKTLAVIAAKNPARQSEVVKIRGNKAYGHIERLKKLEFISSEKSGRTSLLKLLPKFYAYFRISEPLVEKYLSSQTPFNKEEKEG